MFFFDSPRGPCLPAILCACLSTLLVLTLANLSIA
jgi:hypothetical protein